MRPFKITVILFAMSLLFIFLIGVIGPTWAQANGVPAVSQVNANLYTGPNRNYTIVASVPAGTPLTVTARSDDSQWVLATTPGLRRGWIAINQISFAQAVNVASLPVSGEIIGVNAPPAPPQKSSAVPAATITPNSSSVPTTDPAAALGVPALYMNAPILPQVDGSMRAVARLTIARAKALGNNSFVFSKIGDCMTDYSYFLAPFGNGQYDLGPYTNLQAVIKQFSAPLRFSPYNSFNISSLASFSGMTSVGLQEPGWAIKGGNLCSSQESMLACDYRVDKPSVALIMVGFADSQLISTADFGPSIRRLVRTSIKNGVIPILSTFPEFEGRKKEARLMNNDLFNIANEMHVPLINLDAALVGLPSHGVDHDSHLTVPPQVQQSAIFNSTNLQYGITVRNLITLQALDIVWRELMDGG